MTAPADPTLVDGVDIDAVAAAVRGCPAVDDLDGGLLDGTVTYLPGRRVPGIRIADGRIQVHVRGLGPAGRPDRRPDPAGAGRIGR